MRIGLLERCKVTEAKGVGKGDDRVEVAHELMCRPSRNLHQCLVS